MQHHNYWSVFTASTIPDQKDWLQYQNTCKLGLVQKLMRAMLRGELGGTGASNMAQVAAAATVAKLVFTNVLPSQTVAAGALRHRPCTDRIHAVQVQVF